MARQYDEDLFKDSTMTFGEHLDELRRCLFMAVLGLFLGFLLGLMVGHRVVEIIKSPLERAIQRYYLTDSAEKFAGQRAENLAGAGEGLLVDEVYLEAPNVLEGLRECTTGGLDDVQIATNPADHPMQRYGPTHLFPSDFPDPHSLAQTLAGTSPASPPGVRLVWDQLTEASRQAIQQLASKPTLDTNDVARLTAALDILIDTQTLEQHADAAQLQLSLQGQRLWATRDKLDDEAHQRLNRLLLEAALPGQIVVTYPELMPVRVWRAAVDDPRTQTQSLNAPEPFVIYLKASALTGAILSSPWVFFWIWTFVAAGLYPHERRYVYLFLPVSLGLFLLGAAMAFFFVFDPVLDFFLGFNRWLGIDPDPRISEWLSFVMLMPLGFGVSFQLPLVMLFLQRIGVFDVQTYVERWKIAVFVIAVLSAGLTPSGDPWSMGLMALPLLFLYVVGILLCRYLPAPK
jgi:sec-independent protein translocase protein TatC